MQVKSCPHHEGIQWQCRSRGIPLRTLNLSTRWRWRVNLMPQPLYPQERTPAATELKAGWSPEPVCMVLEKRKLFTHSELKCLGMGIVNFMAPQRGQSYFYMLTAVFLLWKCTAWSGPVNTPGARDREVQCSRTTCSGQQKISWGKPAQQALCPWRSCPSLTYHITFQCNSQTDLAV